MIDNAIQMIDLNALGSSVELSNIFLPSTISTVSDSECTSNIRFTEIDVDPSNSFFCSVNGILFSKDMKTLICFAKKDICEYTIPSTVTFIRKSAFISSNLHVINIPSSVEYIDPTAFCNCSELESISVDFENKHFQSIDGILFSKDIRTLLLYPPRKENREYIIPLSVFSISKNAFYSCRDLRQISITSNLKLIEQPAFFECAYIDNIVVDPNNTSFSSIDGVLFSKSLKSLIFYPPRKANKEYSIPMGVEYICDYSFLRSVNLFSVTISSSVQSIGNSAFAHCFNLQSITLENGVKSIGSNAFNDCQLIPFITIPSSVISIGDYAFSECIKLSSVFISKSVNYLGKSLFDYCLCLKQVLVDHNNPFFRCIKGVFYSKDMKTLIYSEQKDNTTFSIPSSVTQIEDSAFSGCLKMKSIMIPSTVTSIGQKAFSTCHSLTSISIPRNIASIQKFTFYFCYSLNSISIPESVTFIDEYAFARSNNLYEIKLPSKLVTINHFAFAWCYKLNIINLPKSLEFLGNCVFFNCIGLTHIVIPPGIRKISIGLFNGCDHLSSIILPETLISIDQEAFIHCIKLAHIELPASVITISERAFADCKSLTSILIPMNVKSMANNVFEDCTELKSITFQSNFLFKNNTEFWKNFPPNCEITFPSDY